MGGKHFRCQYSIIHKYPKANQAKVIAWTNLVNKWRSSSSLRDAEPLYVAWLTMTPSAAKAKLKSLTMMHGLGRGVRYVTYRRSDTYKLGPSDKVNNSGDQCSIHEPYKSLWWLDPLQCLSDNDLVGG